MVANQPADQSLQDRENQMIAAHAPIEAEVQRAQTPLVRIVFLAIICLVASIAAGNRWLGWGKDYEHYIVAYNIISPTFLFGNTRFEIGYELTAWLFAVPLGLSFATFYTSLSFVALSVKFYLFERYLENPPLAAVAYLLLFYSIHEYTQIRAAVAISFGFLALHLLMERKWVYAALLALLSVSFHSSAIALISLGAAVVLMPRKITLAAVPASALILIILSTAAGSWISSTFSEINPLIYNYIDNIAASEALNIFSLANILFAFSLIAMMLFNFQNRDEYTFPFMLLTLFGFAFLIAFRESPVVALRTSEIMMLSVVFAGFRLPVDTQVLVVRGVLLLNGAWITYRAVSEGTLG